MSRKIIFPKTNTVAFAILQTLRHKSKNNRSEREKLCLIHAEFIATEPKWSSRTQKGPCSPQDLIHMDGEERDLQAGCLYYVNNECQSIQGREVAEETGRDQIGKVVPGESWLQWKQEQEENRFWNRREAASRLRMDWEVIRETGEMQWHKPPHLACLLNVTVESTQNIGPNLCLV